ncbi:hypothetical protein F444_22813, partial [Phytophthora nicotianae P1976]
LAGVRASLSALQLAIDQTEALRREFLATRRRAEDLDRQLADAANAASPFVLFYQHKSVSITPASSKLTAFGITSSVGVPRSVSTLEAQLAAASSFGVSIPPATVRRIADLESQLARSQSNLQVARDRQSSLASELRESATSHKAAQAEVDRLEATIERKPRRFRTLRDNYERRLKVADNTIAPHSA